MYQRRRKIVDQNKHRNPAIWSNVGTVLNKLGIQGMSGDETDTEAHRSKKMRCMKHSWLNPKITELWVALDSYQHAVMEELLVKIRNRRGNPGLPRSDTRVRLDSDVPAPKFLPRNWYADDWWIQLNEGAQLAIAAEDPVDIPTLMMRT